MVEAYPPPQTVNVPPEVRPFIRLDEYPQRASVAGAIFVSPDPEGGFEARVRGRRIEVRFDPPLPPDRTVVITFGTGIKDLNGNSMAAPYTLAFSTGDSIDQAGIEGRVEELEDPAATWVWAYPLEAAPDTAAYWPDPRVHRAPFASQPDAGGFFRFSYLPPGPYRVFAVTDMRRNRLWDSAAEAIAIPPADAAASPDAIPTLNLRLAPHDLWPPDLQEASALHRQALRLGFDEPVDLSAMRVFIQAQDGQELAVIQQYRDPADSSGALLTTAPQRPDDVYQVRVDGVADLAGNVADSLTAEAPASVQADTLGPRLTWNRPVAGQTEVNPADTLAVGFSEAVILTDLPRAVHLLDSAGAEVAVNWIYPEPALGQLVPQVPLAGDRRYRLEVWGDSLRDIWGNVAPESLAVIQFTTLDPDATGSISGRVENSPPEARVVIERHGMEGSRQAPVEQGGYEFPQLPAGSYRLWLYRDLDGNRAYSPGRVDSVITFAEPFAFGPDTVRVRPRWDTEDVNLQWPAE
ncbi:MAG: hypothetical protein C4524_11305 [Candidatus Zixiibacteriota bacterium]|nr:MAG: hypothetical protein C4524_11305 [candidate division Zixibacteria bacterium]